MTGVPLALDAAPWPPTPGTPQGLGYRLFSRFSIGTRLAAMMVLAATVSALLAAMGLRGLAAGNESLRTVYEERMTPVRSLAQIAHLMLSNQLQVQMALAQSASAGTRARTTLQPEGARRAAQAMESNMLAIDQLWASYAATPKGPQEAALAERFTQQRTALPARGRQTRHRRAARPGLRGDPAPGQTRRAGCMSATAQTSRP